MRIGTKPNTSSSEPGTPTAAGTERASDLRARFHFLSSREDYCLHEGRRLGCNDTENRV